MRQAACACIILFLVAGATAASVRANRKMLALNTPQAAPGNRRYRPNNNNADAQLAANNAAIVNTQWAIESAVNSGASQDATEAATNYGADQAYWATQATKLCGWHNGRWHNC